MFHGVLVVPGYDSDFLFFPRVSRLVSRVKSILVACSSTNRVAMYSSRIDWRKLALPTCKGLSVLGPTQGPVVENTSLRVGLRGNSFQDPRSRNPPSEIST